MSKNVDVLIEVINENREECYKGMIDLLKKMNSNILDSFFGIELVSTQVEDETVTAVSGFIGLLVELYNKHILKKVVKNQSALENETLIGKADKLNENFANEMIKAYEDHLRDLLILLVNSKEFEEIVVDPSKSAIDGKDLITY